MTLRALALAFYAVLAALNTRSRERSVAVWRELDPLRLTGSFTERQPELLRIVAASQLAAATQAARYVPASVAAQGVFDPPTAILNPDRFAGIASDGRRLDTLLVQPVIATVTAIDRGAKPTEAMALGESALSTIVETQVADAGRAATEAAIAAEPKVRGYIRVLTPPSCGRCTILAGRIYRWSDGFERHERCDCVHQVLVEGQEVPDDLTVDPLGYFQSLSRPEQDRLFGAGAAGAIRDGEDISRAVNAGRRAAGLSRPGAQKRRGSRAMPDELTDRARNRTEAVDLLADAGFLTAA